jgi:hypothetical protein
VAAEVEAAVSRMSAESEVTHWWCLVATAVAASSCDIKESMRGSETTASSTNSALCRMKTQCDRFDVTTYVRDLQYKQCLMSQLHLEIPIARVPRHPYNLRIRAHTLESEWLVLLQIVHKAYSL